MAGAKTSNTLETVVYLASLVSDADAVDPMLDKVRAITSLRQSNQEFTAQDELTFEGVKTQLVDYLTHNDPVRQFTVEGLQQRIQEHFSPVDQLSVQRWVLSGVWTVAIGLSLFAATVPVSISPVVRQQLVAVMTLVTLGIGAAWFFITALRDFKPVLRPAYGLLCLNALLISLGELQLVLVPIFDLGNHPLFLYGGFAVPFTVAIGFAFAGLCLYARTVGVKSYALRLPIVLGVAAVLAVVVVAMPHSATPQYEGFFDLSMVAIAGEIYLAGLGYWLTHRIVAKTATLYARAMRLLGWMLLCSMVGSAMQFAVLFSAGQLGSGAQLLTAVPFILSQVFLLHSAYTFKKAGRY